MCQYRYCKCCKKPQRYYVECNFEYKSIPYPMPYVEISDHGNVQFVNSYKKCFDGKIKNVWNGKTYYSRCTFKDAKLCKNCERFKRGKIIKNLVDKYGDKKIYLWTFGTNLEDNEENRKLVLDHWGKFNTTLYRKSRQGIVLWSSRKYYFDTRRERIVRWEPKVFAYLVRDTGITISLRRTLSWKPIFRVLEKGKSGYLHIHVIVLKYLQHDYVRKLWSDITGIKNPNVNYQVRNSEKIGKAVSYLTKYLLKDGKKNYQYLGYNSSKKKK
jgi:hypothetical protein